MKSAIRRVKMTWYLASQTFWGATRAIASCRSENARFSHLLSLPDTTMVLKEGKFPCISLIETLRFKVKLLKDISTAIGRLDALSSSSVRISGESASRVMRFSKAIEKETSKCCSVPLASALCFSRIVARRHRSLAVNTLSAMVILLVSLKVGQSLLESRSAIPFPGLPLVSYPYRGYHPIALALKESECRYWP